MSNFKILAFIASAVPQLIRNIYKLNALAVANAFFRLSQHHTPFIHLQSCSRRNSPQDTITSSLTIWRERVRLICNSCNKFCWKSESIFDIRWKICAMSHKTAQNMLLGCARGRATLQMFGSGAENLYDIWFCLSSSTWTIYYYACSVKQA